MDCREISSHGSLGASRWGAPLLTRIVGTVGGSNAPQRTGVGRMQLR